MLGVKTLGKPLHRARGPRLPVGVPDPISTFMPQLRPKHYAYFWGALASGIGGLIGLTVATVDLHSVAIETVFIILGSLLVPSLFVYYLVLHNHFAEPRTRTLVLAFLMGVFLAAPLAAVLETFLPAGTGAIAPAMVTGLIEEFCKGLVLLWLLRRRYRNLAFEMDGIILGAAVGMGFAAIEDMIYGTGAFHHGLADVIATVWARQVLGAFGHGTWTAIVGGAIWASKRGGRPRLTWIVLVAYLIAAGLHGLWDWEPLSGYGALLWFLLVGAIGLWILRMMVHQALSQEDAYVSVTENTAPATQNS